MRWRTAGLCVLSLVMLSACPETYGRGGRMDQAAHEDTLESLRQNCSEEEIRKYCEGGREQSAECREHCGEP